MGRIYRYLDIPHYKHDYDNIEQVTKEDDEVYGVFGDHEIRTKLAPVSSRAKSILGKDVCDWIWNNYPWYFQQFRYTK
jgi:sulfotransferase